MIHKEKILIISGPTASGKSDLAKKISGKINAIIINADSMQIYNELPILSSQPSPDDITTFDHALYSILPYDQTSSVMDWLNLARDEIERARESEKIPVIVGGTGFYISSLINGINSIPEITDEIKDEVREFYKKLDKDEFIKNLIDLGDINYIRLSKLDPQRLTRRMEVLKQTGKNLDWWQNQDKNPFYKKENFVHINLNPDREKLYQNCNERLNLMFENGALEEVEEFMKLSPKDDLPITKTIGYFEIRDYLKGLIDKEEALSRACQKTRNYAKRQLTWFRNQFREKYEIADYKNSPDIIENILKQ